MFFKNLIRALFFVAFAALPSLGQAADFSYGFSIGTGSKSGVYYPTGVAICKTVISQTNGLPCVAVNTGGSVDNIARLRSGETNFGIVQADTLYNATHGLGRFKDQEKFPKLRTVLSLYTETFTILARKDSGIRKLDDLKGKRVNIGNLGSGQRASMEKLMQAKGWTKSDFFKATELSFSALSGALCGNEVDAVIYVIAHPSALIQKITETCEVVFVSVTGPDVKKMVRATAFFRPTRIKGNTYEKAPSKVLSFGLKASLVSTLDTLPTKVLTLVESLYAEQAKFVGAHPVFVGLTPEALVPTDEIVPLHFGTAQFFR